MSVARRCIAALSWFFFAKCVSPMANVSAGTMFSVKKAKIAEADMSGNLGVFTRECRGSFVCWDRFLGPEEEKENAGKKVGNEGEGG